MQTQWLPSWAHSIGNENFLPMNTHLFNSKARTTPFSTFLYDSSAPCTATSCPSLSDYFKCTQHMLCALLPHHLLCSLAWQQENVDCLSCRSDLQGHNAPQLSDVLKPARAARLKYAIHKVKVPCSNLTLSSAVIIPCKKLQVRPGILYHMAEESGNTGRLP